MAMYRKGLESYFKHLYIWCGIFHKKKDWIQDTFTKKKKEPARLLRLSPIFGAAHIIDMQAKKQDRKKGVVPSKNRLHLAFFFYSPFGIIHFFYIFIPPSSLFKCSFPAKQYYARTKCRIPAIPASTPTPATTPAILCFFWASRVEDKESHGV